ncbi:MAG: HD domain-containing phosphohydrolase [Micropruina sp.]|uniref:HD domain-containing phosphohydrolase n=1 Tax=Micropruina sp. TaxID=2737536 RepID=UPI0039E2FFB3
MGTDGVRQAELIASLSLATDLGLSLPEGHVLAQTVLATRLARLAGLDDDAQADTFYVSLLAWVGCVADSHEIAAWFGDDRQLRVDSYAVDRTMLPMMRFMLARLGSGSPPVQRLTTIGRFLAGGYREAMASYTTHCETTADIADRLGMRPSVRLALRQAFERWDGRGVPGDLRGDDLEPVIRVVQIADDAEMFARTGGPDAAAEMLRSRRGTEFDPDLVDLAVANAGELFAGLFELDVWEAVIAGCPPLDQTIEAAELTRVLEVLADYADLKSPWYLGHSRAVARLARLTAEASGIADTELVERAGLVHRIGATGVSTSIWDKPSPWTPSEAERVRTVPYLTERVLARQPTLRRIGRIAALAHERLDGSGYPGGLPAAALPIEARLLAAADFYQDLCEDRPRRSALDAASRAAATQAEVRAGRLDAGCAEAVIAAAEGRPRHRTPQVAGLTARELEVLTLLVRGLSTRSIAEQLSVTPRTVTTHLEHIYLKTRVTTRGAAAMFALRHGIVAAD